MAAQPALARDDAPYIEIDAGVLMADAMPLSSGQGQADRIGFNKGYDIGGIAGYDFGPVRVEGEVSYRRAGVKRLTGQFPDNESESFALTSRRGSGRGAALSGMVNLLLDMGQDDGVQFYAGGGLGMARVSLDADDGSFLAVDDRDSHMAWQLLAGARLPISDRADLGLKYRFFKVPGLAYTANAWGPFRAHSRWQSHSLMASLTYNFGAAPAPMPVAPAVPNPPILQPPMIAVPQIPCQTGPFIVFFDWDKSDITPEARLTLDAAASAYGRCGTAQVLLQGHADRSGPADYNVGLSQRRNASVRAYLTGRGISDGAIVATEHGETLPRVITADGVRELQNRRVEILYAPGQ